MELPTIYDNEKRYIFSNWTSEDFIGTWAGVDTLIKSGESIEVPQHKAFHFCKHLVNREMHKDAKVAIDSPEARLDYENKTITQITGGVDSPALSSLKEKIKKEIKIESGEEKAAEESFKETQETKEFEDIKEVKKTKKVKK